MSSGAERRNFSTTQEWVDAVSGYSNEYSEQRKNLLREGYKLFFDTVLELPGLNQQLSKHWSDYKESEIGFVTHDLDRKQTQDEELLRMRISDALGFRTYLPVRIGVFDVQHDREAPVNRNSANIVAESIHGEIFRSRVVINLNYATSDKAADWYEKGISYDLFGLRGDQLNKIQSAREMDLLLAANAAATLYSREINQEGLQTTS